MSVFKDLLAQDVENVFMNKDEFCETHLIDGEEMDAIVDANELIDRQQNMKDNLDGIYTKKILVYVKASQFGKPPKHGSSLSLDNKYYTVANVADEAGVYSITLEDNRA